MVTGSPLRVLVISRFQFARAGLGSLLATQPERATVVDCEPLTVAASAQVALYDVTGPTVEDAIHDVRWLLVRHTPVVGFVRSSLPDLAAVARSRGVLAATVPEDVSAVDLIDTLEATVEQQHALLAQHGDTLTRREREILRRIAQGAPNSEIAEELAISRNTLKSHIRSAYQKVGVTRRVEAVRWAVGNGLDR